MRCCCCCIYIWAIDDLVDTCQRACNVLRGAIRHYTMYTHTHVHKHIGTAVPSLLKRLVISFYFAYPRLFLRHRTTPRRGCITRSVFPSTADAIAAVIRWSLAMVLRAAVSPRWQIYTDWANHYLEKVKSKRRIQDLPNDVTDGVILADVIEAVGKSLQIDI